jgi:hypothetical protein
MFARSPCTATAQPCSSLNRPPLAKSARLPAPLTPPRYLCARVIRVVVRSPAPPHEPSPSVRCLYVGVDGQVQALRDKLVSTQQQLDGLIRDMQPGGNHGANPTASSLYRGIHASTHLSSAGHRPLARPNDFAHLAKVFVFNIYSGN